MAFAIRQTSVLVFPLPAPATNEIREILSIWHEPVLFFFLQAQAQAAAKTCDDEERHSGASCDGVSLCVVQPFQYFCPVSHQSPSELTVPLLHHMLQQQQQLLLGLKAAC
jgi:hypothetical protein